MIRDMDAAKRVAAGSALELIESGMKVGLGSGSTAEIFVEMLAAHVAEAKLDLQLVATSRRTHDLATRLGLVMSDLDQAGRLDIVVDGTDEFDREMALIKGGGGALLHEKIVAEAATAMVVIADDSKRVDRLGAFPLAVEIIETGLALTVARLLRVFGGLGLDGHRHSVRGGGFRTDEGNLIVDFELGAIEEPATVEMMVNNTTGVVENGLFVGICDRILCGSADGTVEVFDRAP